MITAPINPHKNADTLKRLVADVPDFPKPGILFRDISPLLRHHFAATLEEMIALFTPDEWAKIDVIGGIEARGFVMASGLAALQNKGLVNIRKAGKLPGTTVREQYSLEYGKDALEMQPGSGRMLVVDDVLATGGTLATAANLAQRSGHQVQGLACLINLAFLNRFEWQGMHARYALTYEA